MPNPRKNQRDKNGKCAQRGVALAALLFVHPVVQQPCGFCHKEIAARQAQTAMATTWQGKTTNWLTADFKAAVDDYEVERDGGVFTFAEGKRKFPVDFLLGGQRHGIGFLVPISNVDGLPLMRRALVQARYAWSPEQRKLLLAPGCSSEKPQSLEAAMGLTLSPTFEKRCLECHGQNTNGVHCESCHGSKENIVNPGQSMDVCAKCHVGLTRFADPSGDDLLVANQVEAIKRSECFLQSKGVFSCVACHDPHEDAKDNRKAEKVCLSCHLSTHEESGCVGCHMPVKDVGPLHLVDHWIRVHPDQKAPSSNHAEEMRLAWASGYVRMIAANTREGAVRAKERVTAGESFYEVARELSVDKSAAIGGYLGRRDMAGTPGEIRQEGGRWVFYQRLPRDFRWQAEQLLHAGTIEKAQEALKIYPQYLKALTFIGMTYAQAGNLEKGREILALAGKLYPQDAATKFALASVMEAEGDVERARIEFERTIALEKDFTAAYVRLGMLESGQKAIDTFRAGLQIDPMSAELNYDLGQALTRSGNTGAGQQAMALARRLSTSWRP